MHGVLEEIIESSSTWGFPACVKLKASVHVTLFELIFWQWLCPIVGCLAELERNSKMENQGGAIEKQQQKTCYFPVLPCRDLGISQQNALAPHSRLGSCGCFRHFGRFWGRTTLGASISGLLVIVSIFLYFFLGRGKGPGCCLVGLVVFGARKKKE